MRIVVAKPQEDAYIRDVEGELKEYQELVGGYVQAVSVQIGDDMFSLYCNEEAHYQNLPFNRTIDRFNFHGTIVFLNPTSEEGLSKEKANKILTAIN